MNLSSLASSAFATTRSTFKGLAEAAVASGESASPGVGAASGSDAVEARAEKPAPAKAELRAEVKPTGQVDTSQPKPKSVRRGTLLDAYA